MTKLDYFDYELSVILNYGGCIGSPIWMGSGLGCGVAAMDSVVSCLGLFSILYNTLKAKQINLTMA